MRPLVPVRVAQTWFALEAGQVQEVLGTVRWVPIPGAASYLPGVVGWRGRAIALLDLGSLQSGVAKLRVGEVRRRTVVVQAGECTLAVPVDAVCAVEEVDQERVNPPHVTRQPHCRLEVELDGKTMPILDLTDL